MKRATTLKPPKRTSRRATEADNPPWTEEMLGPSRVRLGRGSAAKVAKVVTTIRLDRDVIEHYRATGRDYQARMNRVLRDAMRRERGA